MFPSLMPDLIGIDAEPEASIAIASDAGFEGLDLRLNRFAERITEPAAFASRMHDAGLTPGYCSLTPQKIGVSKAEWQAGMEALPSRAAVARALGYTRATSVVLPFSDDLDRDTNDALHISRIREAADILLPFGISFGVEYVAPLSRRKGHAHEYVHTLEQTLELLDRVARPNTGLMLDCFHWQCADETEDDIAALDPARIIAVHLNDFVPGRPPKEQLVTERLLPAESGLIDINGFMRGLDRAGYTGPLTSEPTHPRWASTDDADAASQTLNSIRRALSAARIP